MHFFATIGEFIKNWRPRYFVLRSDGTFTGYKQPPVGGIYPEIMNEFNVEGKLTTNEY